MAKFSEKTGLTAYSSDGSIYQIDPKMVWQVENSKDIKEAIDYARSKGLSITPRGGGTGLTGGALGDGIILDFGKFKQIIAIDPTGKIVITQVGIIYDELNLGISKFNLFFPPDPSSGDSCQIGGMISNNSSGPRSVKYGLTSEFIQELGVYKPDGNLIYLRKLKVDSVDFNTFLSENPEYKTVYDLLIKNSDLIKEKWPRLKKNSAGYNLYQVVRELDYGIFNLPALMAGSEGTLAILASAKLNLLKIPEERLTARLYFNSMVEAGQAVEPILKLAPSGLEIVDGATLDLIGREKHNIPGSAAGMLLLEFDEDTEIRREQFLDLVETLDLSAPVDFAFDAESAAPLWKARKAIVPTLYRHHPTKRPISLIEDVSLPPQEIPAFIEFITDLFDKHNLIFGIFGHIGDGNLHIRPLFDLNVEADFELAKEIYDTVYDKVIGLGGSITAEHADGMLRAPVLKKMYGEKIYDLFVEIKKTLDPDNLLSPDSIISTKPFADNIDFEKIKSYCAACGKCNGYCPVYDYFRREDMSPRGWLRILNQSAAKRKDLDKYLDYCLNCKNCATVCPAGVKISDEIMKYRAGKRSALSKAIVAVTDNDALFGLTLKLGKMFEPMIASDFGKSIISTVGKKPFGFDKSTEFPKLAKENLRQRFESKLGDSGDVALFHGCADNLLESNFGEALFNIFDRLNIDLKIPEQKCCGLPHETYGHRENMIGKAKYNIDKLVNFDKVITGCASCLLKLKEYEELFEPGSEYHAKAVLLKNKSMDISELLNSLDLDFSDIASERPYKISYHNPCHLRAAGLHKEPEKLMANFDNLKIIHPQYADRCCAQAGSYGFTHFSEAKGMFDKKREEYFQMGVEYILTSCPACKMKIKAELGGNFKVLHPVEFLNIMAEHKMSDGEINERGK